MCTCTELPIYTTFTHTFTYCFAEITRVRRSYMYICTMCIIFLPYGLWLVLWENMSSAKCENCEKHTCTVSIDVFIHTQWAFPSVYFSNKKKGNFMWFSHHYTAWNHYTLSVQMIDLLCSGMKSIIMITKTVSWYCILTSNVRLLWDKH